MIARGECPMRQRRLHDGTEIPAVGQGSWGLGKDRRRRTREIDALRRGVEAGMTVIDSAEFYSAGEAERVVGEAVRDIRDRVFITTKVWPVHARAEDVVRSVRESKRRIGVDVIDAVLLHWPTRRVPLAETLGALAKLRRDGDIRHFGVSNFDGRWLQAAEAALPAEEHLAMNQVPYSLDRRGIEHEVLPAAQRMGFLVQAYSPLAHGRRIAALTASADLRAIAAAHDVTPVQVALAFLLRQEGVIVIPKASSATHARENAAAGDLVLTPEEETRIAAAFPLKGAFRPDLPDWMHGPAWSAGRVFRL